MSSGRIRFGQIDGLKEDTQATANDGDLLVYDQANEEFKSETPEKVVGEVVIFRRIMLLMGG